MNAHINKKRQDQAPIGKIRVAARIRKMALAFAVTIVIFAIRSSSAQSAPVLSITSLGTNVFYISTTNSIGTATYDLLWTPALDNPSYPWTWAAVGTPGQTNYVVNMAASQTGFFRTILDTNSVPLWEAADPNNPSAGILTVFIDSPTNGFNLTQ